MLTFDTKRLRIRPFNMDDLDEFAIICQDPDVMRYIGGGTPLKRSDVKKQMTKWIADYEQDGFGLMALIHKRDNKLIGFCGLIRQIVDGEDHIELGYRLAKAYWRKGLATEAAIKMRDFAFNSLKLPELISIIHPENIASQKLANKCGMTLLKKTTFQSINVLIYCMESPKASTC